MRVEFRLRKFLIDMFFFIVAILCTAGWLAQLEAPNSRPYWMGLGGIFGGFFFRLYLLDPEIYALLTGIPALILGGYILFGPVVWLRFLSKR